jgi:hypothetical protein
MAARRGAASHIPRHLASPLLLATMAIQEKQGRRAPLNHMEDTDDDLIRGSGGLLQREKRLRVASQSCWVVWYIY